MRARPQLIAVLLAALSPAFEAEAQFSQQGSKLVGTGGVAPSRQGTSVAVSGDGNTVVTGGYIDNGSLGAAWVYARGLGVWSQQGAKLVGTGGSIPQLGRSVALSADGNTIVVGGPSEVGTGAVWIFVSGGGFWLQEGAKLVGTGGWVRRQGLPSRCPRTGTPPSWVDRTTTAAGCSLGVHA